MKQGKQQNPVKRIGMAQLVLAVSTMVICALLSLVIQTEKIPEQIGGVVAEVLLELIVFGVCFFTVRPMPQARLPLSMATAGAFVLLRIIFKAIVFPGAQWTMMWGLILTAVAGAMAGIMASTKKQRRR